METSIATTLSTLDAWRNSYTAALFEENRDKVPGLIARAEGEIVTRARLLFGTPGDHVGEMRSLDHALHMLKVLKSCYKDLTAERTELTRDRAVA